MLSGRKNPMPKTALRAAFALCLCLFFAAAPTAFADTDDIIAPSDVTHPEVDSGWQAGTCEAEPCSIATPDLFFETAGAHPNYGFTQFIIKHGPPPTEAPVGELKTVRVDLPVGLSVNPGATPRCTRAQFESDTCPLTSKVGESLVTAAGPLGPIDPVPGVTQVPVYNVQPEQGEAARFGLKLAGNEVFLEGDVAWDSDYHAGFTIHLPAALPHAVGGAL